MNFFKGIIQLFRLFINSQSLMLINLLLLRSTLTKLSKCILQLSQLLKNPVALMLFSLLLSNCMTTPKVIDASMESTQPSQRMINLLIAQAYEKKGLFHDAKHYYQAAFQYSPADFTKESQIHNNYGVFLCQQKHYQQGQQHLLIAFHDKNYAKRWIAYQNLLLCKKQEQEIATTVK